MLPRPPWPPRSPQSTSSRAGKLVEVFLGTSTGIDKRPRNTCYSGRHFFHPFIHLGELPYKSVLFVVKHAFISVSLSHNVIEIRV